VGVAWEASLLQALDKEGVDWVWLGLVDVAEAGKEARCERNPILEQGEAEAEEAAWKWADKVARLELAKVVGAHLLVEAELEHPYESHLRLGWTKALKRLHLQDRKQEMSLDSNRVRGNQWQCLEHHRAPIWRQSRPFMKGRHRRHWMLKMRITTPLLRLWPWQVLWAH